MSKKHSFFNEEEFEDSEIIKSKKDRRIQKKNRKKESRRLQKILFEVNNHNQINWEDYDESFN